MFWCVGLLVYTQLCGIVWHETVPEDVKRAERLRWLVCRGATSLLPYLCTYYFTKLIILPSASNTKHNKLNSSDMENGAWHSAAFALIHSRVFPLLHPYECQYTVYLRINASFCILFLFGCRWCCFCLLHCLCFGLCLPFYLCVRRHFLYSLFILLVNVIVVVVIIFFHYFSMLVSVAYFNKWNDDKDDGYAECEVE